MSGIEKEAFDAKKKELVSGLNEQELAIAKQAFEIGAKITSEDAAAAARVSRPVSAPALGADGTPSLVRNGGGAEAAQLYASPMAKIAPLPASPIQDGSGTLCADILSWLSSFPASNTTCPDTIMRHRLLHPPGQAATLSKPLKIPMYHLVQPGSEHFTRGCECIAPRWDQDYPGDLAVMAALKCLGCAKLLPNKGRCDRDHIKVQLSLAAATPSHNYLLFTTEICS